MNRKLLSALLLCLTFSAVQSQDKNFKNWFQAAQEHMLYEEYNEALKKYALIESHGQLNSNVAFNMGMCYMNLGNQVENAIPYLEKAVVSTSATYKEGNYKEMSAPEEAWFYLGKAYRLTGQYTKAIDAYREFRARLNASDLYYQDFIALQIESCTNAEKMMKSPLTIDIIKPDFSIDAECYFPAVAGDEKSVVFTSYQKVRDPYTGVDDYFELIFYSTKGDDGSWSKPLDITYDIASDGNFSTASLSYHGDMMILYRDDFGNGNLYYSKMENGKWSEIKKFPKNIDSKYNETHGSLSKDGRTLFFVSDRPGGQGGKDIYRSLVDNNGNWGTPVALSYIINTPFDEDAAFLADDDVTLYFVSEAHSTMGGFDIFKSVVDNNGNWSDPQNLGYPISTPYDDMFYNPIGDGTVGYMDRVPEAGGAKEMRRISPPVQPSYSTPEPVIAETYTPEYEPATEPSTETYTPEPVVETYTPTYPSEYKLTGKLTLQDNKELNSSFYLHVADASGQVIASLSPNVATGQFATVIKPGSYKITAYGDGYEPADAYIYVSEYELNPEVNTALNMIPKAVSTGEYYSIKSILFDDNSARLNRDAEIEIERIAALMQANPDLKLEVTGNTDDLGTDDYNQRLSVMRAREVVNYLTKKGIAESRLVAKGLGKTNFIAINQNPDGSDNPEGRALNRRVDMNVLNPTNANITVEGIYVPDELKYKKQLTYTIWITESQKPLSPSQFKNINNVWIFEADGQYMYTVGLFTHQGQAVQMMGEVVDAGFPDARIISSLEYNQLIQKGSNFYKSKMADPDVNTYTIQLMATKQPVAKSRFRGLFDVEEHQGDDGYYRYTWGEYIGKTSAKQALDDVLNKGFIDAFVVNADKFK
jgi:outer membrane protein OmpA-like peptidoglycan-associated protein/tetratricopeptide (TPR) repeat protein